MQVGTYEISEHQKEHIRECVKLFNEKILPRIDNFTMEVEVKQHDLVMVTHCCALNQVEDMGRRGVVLHAEPKYSFVLLEGDTHLSAFRNEDLQRLGKEVRVLQL